MRRLCLPSILALFVFCAMSAQAADLTKIDRPIKKEPVYKSKPKYCLLVFGPEAKTKVWLVQDGDTLYVDRNGNGDLTESGKKVAAKKEEGSGADGVYTFEAGEIHEGGRVHKNLNLYVMKIDHMADNDQSIKSFLAQNPKGRGYYLFIETDLPGWKGKGIGGRVQQRAFVVDVNGVLQFADKPQDAPIIHFGGPWQVTLFGKHQFTIDREVDAVLGVGTPGVGPGTTAWVDYSGVIPEKVYPVLDITFPPQIAGGPPVHERYELKRRC